MIECVCHSSFSMLWGPTNHFKHLINTERLPFTLTYLVTLLGTIYYSVWVNIPVDFRQIVFLVLLPIKMSLVTIENPCWVFTAFFLGKTFSIKEHHLFNNTCVLEKERRLALPLTRTEGLRTYI